MNHREYYQFQAQARGMHSVDDVRRMAGLQSFLYERIALPWLPKDTALPIAELACGHGSVLHWLSSRGCTNVIGVDASAQQIELARQVGVKVELEDANHWLARQPKNHYAAILAIDLIEHLEKDDFMDLLHLAHEALADGGSLILRLPNGESPFVGRNLYNDITHVWAYTPNAINSLSQMHGYSAAQFADEGADAIRDHRWFKVPLARAVRFLAGTTVRMITRVPIQFWSDQLWARLTK